MENAETTRDQPDGGSMQDILSLQHSTDTYSLTLPAQGEISALAQRGYEGYWLWNHLMRPSWLWDHLMRPSWLWDHLMRPTLRARGEIELLSLSLPSTPGKYWM